MASQLGVSVDDRIQLSADRGTVRYTGPLKGREGEWVGVEWDEASRGRHDGVVDGVRYFETRGGAPSGSFVLSDRFAPGRDLVAALRQRYGEEAYDDEDMFVSTTGNKSKRVELVGLQKIEQYQRNTGQLRTVDLSGSGVSGAGSVEDLGRLLSKLEELNVGYNFFREWETVLDVVRALPRLAILNLSGNPFLRSQRGGTAPKPDPRFSEAGLQTLVLNECRMGWAQATSVAAWFPGLRELQVCHSSIAELPSPSADGLRSLEVVDLSFNRIELWKEVCRLSRLPRLKRLNLTGNLLRSVEFDPSVPGFFGALESILLGDCQIGGWDSVDALNLFPELKETRVSGNPLLQNIAGGGRFEVVARVGGLVQLNGSGVSRQERTDCERRYASYVANHLLQSELGRDAVLALHPRYLELVARHGEPTTSAAAARQTGALLENVVEITLVCQAPSATMGEETKKVSQNMTLGSLRVLIEKLFALPRSKMRLFLKAADDRFPEDITDVKDDKRLGDLYLANGQQILINE